MNLGIFVLFWGCKLCVCVCVYVCVEVSYPETESCNVMATFAFALTGAKFCWSLVLSDHRSHTYSQIKNKCYDITKISEL